ncbi:LysM domain-containing protein [Haloactinospora alba]|uniref:LysM domain-containing protein n=1 Tax=Haloactinospora alba TaxID=405555 RepID=A0A543NKI9_9ACTN|nr:LysM peptidoglycan-binding domain-containing protein [Haloactinospora alba]TQN32319.1 LysM domain-containing protein [Haloactinospora alba]
MSEPALFDWTVEIPEWRADTEDRQDSCGTSPVAGLTDLRAAAVGGRGMRLTRRGRVALVSVLCFAATVGVAMVVMTAVAAGASASGPTPNAMLPGSATTTITVRDGDTLWGIAEQIRPGEDPRRTVHEIVELNDLSDSTLVPGQTLVLPTAESPR